MNGQLLRGLGRPQTFYAFRPVVAHHTPCLSCHRIHQGELKMPTAAATFAAHCVLFAATVVMFPFADGRSEPACASKPHRSCISQDKPHCMCQPRQLSTDSSFDRLTGIALNLTTSLQQLACQSTCINVHSLQCSDCQSLASSVVHAAYQTHNKQVQVCNQNTFTSWPSHLGLANAAQLH